ncbi:MAG: undecaprenyl-diphosphate phosphatase [Clostridia bacterium]|nr:undecaprenyl-diphosphate phosphatase [Clostridia bacterium]
MKLLYSILLGIIQGLGEFLPISSSGHLALAQTLLGLEVAESNLAFNVLLHLGTLMAVFIVFYKDIFELIRAFFSLLGKLFHKNFKLSSYTLHERFVVLLLIAILPLIPAAVLSGYIEILMGYPIVVGAILVLNGILLYVSERFATGQKDLENVTPLNALVVGLCQVVAILPGLSRSGSTITGGLTQGFTRPVAVKFSFILSIPAILGAAVLELPALFTEIADTATLFTYLAGAFAAMIVGILAIKLVSWISEHATFKGFAYYCFAIGTVAIVMGILQ